MPQKSAIAWLNLANARAALGANSRTTRPGNKKWIWLLRFMPGPTRSICATLAGEKTLRKGLPQGVRQC